jgi:hypothetical protein
MNKMDAFSLSEEDKFDAALAGYGIEGFGDISKGMVVTLVGNDRQAMETINYGIIGRLLANEKKVLIISKGQVGISRAKAVCSYLFQKTERVARVGQVLGKEPMPEFVAEEIKDATEFIYGKELLESYQLSTMDYINEIRNMCDSFKPDVLFINVGDICLDYGFRSDQSAVPQSLCGMIQSMRKTQNVAVFITCDMNEAAGKNLNFGEKPVISPTKYSKLFTEIAQQVFIVTEKPSDEVELQVYKCKYSNLHVERVMLNTIPVCYTYV